MQRPEHIPAMDLADAIRAVEAAADPSAAGTAYTRAWRRWERRLRKDGVRVDAVDRELALGFAFVWANSPRLRAARISHPRSPVAVASIEETAGFLKECEASRLAVRIGRAVEVLAGKAEPWRRGIYLRGRVEAVKTDAVARGVPADEVRSLRATFVDEVVRQSAPSPHPSAPADHP